MSFQTLTGTLYDSGEDMTIIVAVPFKSLQLSYGENVDITMTHAAAEHVLRNMIRSNAIDVSFLMGLLVEQIQLYPVEQLRKTLPPERIRALVDLYSSQTNEV